MNSQLRISGMAAATIVLAACAVTNGKPDPQIVAVKTENPPCLGTRIPTDSAHCTSIGRSHSGDAIDSTGKTTVAGALPLLDPAITVKQY
jgi:hypothetical protein